MRHIIWAFLRAYLALEPCAEGCIEARRRTGKQVGRPIEGGASFTFRREFVANAFWLSGLLDLPKYFGEMRPRPWRFNMVDHGYVILPMPGSHECQSCEHCEPDVSSMRLHGARRS